LKAVTLFAAIIVSMLLLVYVFSLWETEEDGEDGAVVINGGEERLGYEAYKAAFHDNLTGVGAGAGAGAGGGGAGTGGNVGVDEGKSEA
jgi:hypothetical protein